MKSPLKRKTDKTDMLIMLKVFVGCIKTGIIPSPKSPCMKILRKIIKDNKKRGGK